MNYKQKIEELTQKGIFTQEQADKLGVSSPEEKEMVAEVTTGRRFTLEIVGAALVGISLFFISISSTETKSIKTIEDVSHSLNSPISSGITAQNSFLLIFMFIAVALFLFLYLYSQNRYKNFWRMSGEIKQIQSDIHERIIINRELDQTLKSLLKEEKVQNTLVDTRESSTIHVMNIIEEKKESLRFQKEKLNLVQEKCNRDKKILPGMLAKLVGKLPLCN